MALEDYLVQLDLLVLLECLDRREVRVSEDLRVRSDHLDPSVLLVRRVLWVRQEIEALQDQQDEPDRLGWLDSVVIKDCLEIQVQLVPLESQELLGIQATRAIVD
jgi:hypothetical protein